MKNNIGFLGTASKDDKEKINKFYKRFENTSSELSHFNLTSGVNDFSQWLLSKDIVYVGGGNTFFMLEIWKKNDLEKVFKLAYEKGIILSGVSAGLVPELISSILFSAMLISFCSMPFSCSIPLSIII